MSTHGERYAALLLVAVLATPAPAEAAPPAGQVTVVVTLRDRADLTPFRHLPRRERLRGVAEALRRRAGQGQGAVQALLRARRAQGQVSGVTSLWISNGLSVTATPAVVRELLAHPDVLSVTPDEVPIVPTGGPVGPPTWNVAAVAAPSLWSLGLTGQGVVVASLDTGVDASHPDLAPRWRGGGNSWFDPYGQHTTPYDPSGHGTWIMGVLVGGDASGAAIGVAPDARWISAKIFDDAGRATATAIHLAYQWVLDPDGDPATADAPLVVNNSWAYGAPGCNLEFQRDLQALVAAGIVPVFAAGNFGPAAASSVSPANYPEAFSVGAVAASGAAYAGSSRGPSACTGATFPSVVAPGVDVTTADLYGFYTASSGSSLAAPHVAGVLALLREAFPDATVEALEQALQRTALDLGPAGPDDTFGSGLVSALAAHDDLAAPPPPTPPTAAADAFAASAGVLLEVPAPGVLANDTSGSGRPLTAALVAPPTHGVVALLADGGFGYTADAGYAGPDAFTYLASDGTLQSAPATVALSVAAPPAPPVAADDAYTVVAGTSATFTAPGVLGNDVDPAGRPLSATLVTSTGHGALLLQADGGFTYTPAPGFSGTDAFGYVAGDGLASSALATVTLTVPPAPPAASPDAYAVPAGQALTVVAPGVLANDVDPAGLPLTAQLVAGPAHGTLTLQASGAFTYQPAAGFSGADGFSYLAGNGGAASAVTAVAITVSPPGNLPPVAVDDAATTRAGTSVTIAVLANDYDPDGTLAATSVAIVTKPRSGTATRKTNGTVVYAPARRFKGSDSFTYTVKDAAGAVSNVATVQVLVR